MADELERLHAIRAHRLTRAQSLLRRSQRAVEEQTRTFTEAQRAERAWRTALPEKLAAAFAPILRVKVRLAPVAAARQRESALRARAEDYAEARRSARAALEAARQQAAEHAAEVRKAARKQEALHLLQAEHDAEERRTAERQASDQLDEFAEQSYWRGE